MEVDPREQKPGPGQPDEDEAQEALEEGGEAVGDKLKEGAGKAKDAAGKTKDAAKKAKGVGEKLAKKGGEEALKKGVEETANQAANVATEGVERGAQAAASATGIGAVLAPIIEFFGDAFKLMPSWMKKWGCSLCCGCAVFIPIVIISMLLFAGFWWQSQQSGGGDIDPKTGVGDTVTMTDVPLYKQWDPKWGSTSYGCSGTTIASSGCGITSLAMVISYHTSKEVLPPETAKISLNSGWRVCGSGTSWAAMTEMPKKYGLSGKAIDWSQAKTYLKQGMPVIQSHKSGYFTGGGHFIVVTGGDAKGYLINDPDGKHRDRASESQITDSLKQSWVILQ